MGYRSLYFVKYTSHREMLLIKLVSHDKDYMLLSVSPLHDEPLLTNSIYLLLIFMQRQDSDQSKILSTNLQNFIKVRWVVSEIKHADRQVRTCITSSFYVLFAYKVKPNNSEQNLHVELRGNSVEILKDKMNGQYCNMRTQNKIQRNKLLHDHEAPSCTNTVNDYKANSWN